MGILSKVTDVPIGGFQSSIEEADWVVIGYPLDETASYRKGCGEAPEEIRKMAANLETPDPISGRDIAEVRVHDRGNLTTFDRGKVENYISQLTAKNKRVLLLGGEHTITHAALPAYKDHLFIVFDAHTDLRDTYEGNPYSHACIIRRLLEDIDPSQLIFIGTRAVSMEERTFLENNPEISVFWSIEWQEQESKFYEIITNKLEDYRGIYLSVDMDGFDPAYVPGVGNPEPLGLTTHEFFRVLHRLPSIEGADINELNPRYDPTGASTAVAARLAMSILTHH